MRRISLALCLVVALSAADVPSAQETVFVRAPEPWEGVPPPFQFLFGKPVDSVSQVWASLPFDRITLVRDTCFGTCPAYKVIFYRRVPGQAAKEDDDLGKAEFSVTKLGESGKYWRRFPEALGEFNGMIHISEFARLSYLIQKLRFLELQDDYSNDMTDGATTWVSVSGPGGTKTVRNYRALAPIEMWGIQEALESAAMSIKWTKK